KEGLSSAPDGFAPWFSHARRKTRGQKLIFGHWAALDGQCDEPGLYALDTGCVWGGAMTLLNVDSGELHRCECQKPIREARQEPAAAESQSGESEGASLLACGLHHLYRLFRSRP